MKRSKLQAIIYILSMYAAQQATYRDLIKEAKKLWTDESYLMAEATIYGA